MSKTPLKTELPSEYPEFIRDLKHRIQFAQVKAALSVNRELISLYWDIGKLIVERQEQESWGKSVLKQIEKDLRNAFPQVKGFSSSNLWRMRALYLAYTEEVKDTSLDTEKLAQLVRELPWGHNLLIFQKIKVGKPTAPKLGWNIYAASFFEHDLAIFSGS